MSATTRGLAVANASKAYLQMTVLGVWAPPEGTLFQMANLPRSRVVDSFFVSHHFQGLVDALNNRGTGTGTVFNTSSATHARILSLSPSLSFQGFLTS